MIADVMRPEREHFEAWAKDHRLSVETEEGDYLDPQTRLAASAFREGMRAEWQPISTAPKDASRILIYTPSSTRKVQEVWWAIPYEGSSEGYWSTPYGPGGRGYTILPEAATHWMHLPQPPKDTP